MVKATECLFFSPLAGQSSRCFACLVLLNLQSLVKEALRPSFTGEDVPWGLETSLTHAQAHRSAAGTQACLGPSAISAATLHQFRKGQCVLCNARQAMWSLWDQAREWVLVGTVPRAATCQMSLGCDLQKTNVVPQIISPRSSNNKEHEKSSTPSPACRLPTGHYFAQAMSWHSEGDSEPSGWDSLNPP